MSILIPYRPYDDKNISFSLYRYSLIMAPSPVQTDKDSSGDGGWCTIESDPGINIYAIHKCLY